MYDKALNLRSVYGSEKNIYIKDLISFENKLGSFFTIKTKEENILCGDGFIELQRLIEDIKKENKNFYVKEKQRLSTDFRNNLARINLAIQFQINTLGFNRRKLLSI